MPKDPSAILPALLIAATVIKRFSVDDQGQKCGGWKMGAWCKSEIKMNTAKSENERDS